ncbi:MAG: ornithine carbamoyltransferase [Planctomycetota bacterium]|nr:MAG: ornithine carbamoyltransferase [Planctomycetota bacterium]
MKKHDFGTLPVKDLVSISQLGVGDIATIFSAATELKRNRYKHDALLRGRRLAMIFEKESLRTRFTFDVGIQDLGGSAVFLDHRDARLGSRESIKDMAKNLERWVHGIVARTFKHKHVEELAANCSIPVVNGLSDFLHPCQGLTDFFTLSEKLGDVRGKKIAYVGDGNNTCHSLLQVASKLGCHISVGTPEGYEPNSRIVSEAMLSSRESGSLVEITNDAEAAVAGADAVYTDVWASMGQEDEREERAAIFLDYQVDEDLMARAKPNALFMHCLPAHRGHEVSAGVMDGANSIVYDIAENRLHVQKAILVLLMGKPALVPVGV